MRRDIGEWLDELGLGRYADAFAENEIDFDSLPHITEQDLREIGVALGPRRKLLAAIAEIDGLDGSLAPEMRHDERSTGTEAERRQLTVMFVDLVGSTELATRLDPEDMRDVIRAFQDASAGVITRFEGHIAKYMGDGILAYFGWPRAHEDEAERACHAALQLARTIDELAAVPDGKLAVRVGISSGVVVVGDLIGEGAAREQSVSGDTPHLAARLQALAAPGSVVVGPVTARLAGDVFELRSLGRHGIKGFSEKIEAFEVIGERAVLSRFEAKTGPAPTTMFGREQELALLLERWSRAKAGEGQGVLLIGEAGIGKSRISKALLDAVSGEAHTHLRYQCSPYHTESALWPVIEQLGHATGLSAAEGLERRLDKLEALLARAGEISDDAAPLIAHLIGLEGETRYAALNLSPQAQRSRTLGVLIDQVIGLARQAPVLMLLEDAHWIDPTTLELIEQILDRIADTRVLTVLTSRPDNQPALSGHPHITRLSLNRLGRNDVEAIVAGLDGGELSAATIDTIIDRTDGVPLFVEELTKAVREAGDTVIPASLNDSLMARLDRIHEVKEIAQIAAVIGRQFDYRLLDAVADRPASELQIGLDRLAAAEIVIRRGTPPDARYTFKHALVQDAAYQSLLRAKRQSLHDAIARALESQFQEIAALQPELVAHHFTEAGKAEPASGYWRRAADRALQQSANIEAIAHYEQALRLLAELPATPERDAREVDLRLGLGAAMIAPKGYAAEAVRDAFSCAEQLTRGAADTDRRFRALRGLWNWHLIRGQLAECQGFARQISDLATTSGEPARRLMAGRIVGTTGLATGRYVEAAQHLAAALDTYEPARQDSYILLYGEDPGLFCHAYLAWLNDWLGYRDQAADQLERAITVARGLPNQYSLCSVLALGAFTQFYRNDPDAAHDLADETIRVATEQGVAQWLAAARAFKGWAIAARGNLQGGLALARRGCEDWRALGGVYQEPKLLSVIADIHCLAHEYQDALECLDAAVRIIDAERLRQWIAEVYQRRGCVLAALTRDREAVDAFEKALDIARAQKARTFELKAALGLAKLLHRQGNTEEARALLAPVHDWFTEGFDTADLKDAKALLDALG